MSKVHVAVKISDLVAILQELPQDAWILVPNKWEPDGIDHIIVERFTGNIPASEIAYMINPCCPHD